MRFGSNCNIFHFPKQVSNPTTNLRNIPEGADVDISTLPGGDDDKVHQLGDLVPDSNISHQKMLCSKQKQFEIRGLLRCQTSLGAQSQGFLHRLYCYSWSIGFGNYTTVQRKQLELQEEKREKRKEERMWQAIEAEMEKEREQAEALALIERKKAEMRARASATSSRNNAECSCYT